MKRVKIMLSAILVMAIVAGALAFKAKSPNVCVYTTTLNATTTKTTCPLITTGDFNTTTLGARVYRLCFYHARTS